jgi:hypothetical protein
MEDNKEYSVDKQGRQSKNYMEDDSTFTSADTQLIQRRAYSGTEGFRAWTPNGVIFCGPSALVLALPRRRMLSVSLSPGATTLSVIE